MNFTNSGRTFDREEELELISVGVDIGSSTSHLVFSKLILKRAGNRYSVSERHVLYESEVMLTPYADHSTIDAGALGTFISQQYRLAEIGADDIDTGALILTGVAMRKSNARAIGDLFSAQAGKFVAVSAGDALEAMLVAYGSGAVARSAGQKNRRIMNVDIGGGTSKITLCEGGEITDVTVIDIGARTISFDNNKQVLRVEEAGRFFADRAGIPLVPGKIATEQTLQHIAENMADKLFQAMGVFPLEAETESLLRLSPLKETAKPDVITFSGGVSEYIYGRASRNYGDLGPLLAKAINARLQDWPTDLEPAAQNIRATVVGASQYSIQVSGNTVFVHPMDVLPLRNVPVIAPSLPLTSEELDAKAIGEAVVMALQQYQAVDQAIALYYRWDGSATFARISTFCEGLIAGFSSAVSAGLPLIIVTDGDVGGLIGLHCHETFPALPIVSIDGILLKNFDFIDIGAFLETSGAVPVVIKSLVFPSSDALGRA